MCEPVSNPPSQKKGFVFFPPSTRKHLFVAWRALALLGGGEPSAADGAEALSCGQNGLTQMGRFNHKDDAAVLQTSLTSK